MAVAGVTGIVLTKLDGTAKGGMAVAIAHDLELPIRYVGVGEGIDDLLPFNRRGVRRRAVRGEVVTDERPDAARAASTRRARRARPTPNPLVGAVVVSSGGVIVGQGRHPRAGEPHAEVLRARRGRGAGARAATLYVTLEPCCHHGRTPPCTQRIIESGVSRVVVAMEDPNPVVHGQGIAELRAAGIAVEVGLLEAEARRLNRPFVSVQTLGRPEVIVKAATSADGRIAARPGVRTAISSPASARRTQHLRAVVDAVAVGSGNGARGRSPSDRA